MSKVRAGHREAPDQADGPVYDHAQAPEEHRSKPEPVAASYIKRSVNKKIYLSEILVLRDLTLLRKGFFIMLKQKVEDTCFSTLHFTQKIFSLRF